MFQIFVVGFIYLEWNNQIQHCCSITYNPKVQAIDNFGLVQRKGKNEKHTITPINRERKIDNRLTQF